MLQVSAGDWLIDVDTEATKSFYETATTELCNCAYCRNYAAAYPNHFLADFLQFLRSMMIDPLKPAQISEFGMDGKNNHQYGGNFDFVGTVVRRSNGPLADGERYSIDDIPSYAPHINIRFSVLLPWVIEENGESFQFDSGK